MSVATLGDNRLLALTSALDPHVGYVTAVYAFKEFLVYRLSVEKLLVVEAAACRVVLNLRAKGNFLGEDGLPYGFEVVS